MKKKESKSMIYLKQQGARRTGTNYLKRLILLNFQNVMCFSNIGGWKHGKFSLNIDWNKGETDGKNWNDLPRRRSYTQHCIKEIVNDEILKAFSDRKIGYLISTKNPYSWYYSMLKKYSKIENFQNKKDLKKLHAKKIPKLIKNWNELYKNWLTIHDYGFKNIIIRIEDLIQDFEKELEKIQNTFNLKRLSKIWVNETFIVPPLRELNGLAKIKEKKFNPDFYSEERYLDFFSKNVLRDINNNLDIDLCKKLGYVVKNE